MPNRADDDTTIRGAAPADASPITVIYNHYVRETVVTFEEEPVAAAEMVRRIAQVETAGLPWLVAQLGGEIVGYAYATPWRPRSGYRFSAEITVYLAPGHAGHGIGSRLYEKLLPTLLDRNIHTVMGGIALPNEASVALHEKFGLRKVAQFAEVGFKFNRWIDVGYWQRAL